MKTAKSAWPADKVERRTVESLVPYAMELNPPYVDVAIKRWQDFTGEKAVLEGDGRTFEDVAAHRYNWEKDAVGSYNEAIAAKREELTHARA